MNNLIDDPISHDVFIQASRERVYDALTTSSELDSWFTTGASVDARPGGEIWWRWKDWGPNHVTTEDGGPVLVAQRPERFVFQWHPDDPRYSTIVEFALEEASGGTIVRLRESGYEDTPTGCQALIGCATGWGEALTLLKFYLEHGIRY
jgi:uncharacterized protein YndB with AHSA1/START domain